MKETNRPDLAYIYTRAALNVADDVGYYCCGAIDVATNGLDRQVINQSHDYFSDLFKPEGKSFFSLWFGRGPYSRTHRITALLLMAEMARQGDL